MLVECDVKHDVEKNRNEKQEKERFSKNYILKIGYEWKSNETEDDTGFKYTFFLKYKFIYFNWRIITL